VARFQRTFTVTQTPETVFAYVADPQRSAEWDATVAAITARPDGDGHDLVAAFYGRRISFHVRGAQAEPDLLVERRGTHASAVLNERFELAPAAGGTSVTYTAEVRLTGPLRLFNKGLDSAFAAVKAKSADRLAGALETRRTVS
jgi:carbon monoxide dehydrogenase subunit G